MDFAYDLAGGGLIKKSYMAGETLSTAGVPLIGSTAATTDLGSVLEINNASEAAIIGLSLDTTGTVAATGITDSDDIMVNCVINPNGVYRARLSGDGTSGTALSATATTGASANGTVTTGVTTIDDGVVWGFTGANAGEFRRADDASGSVSINFPNAIATGDQFLVAPGFIGFVESATQAFFDLTSDFTEVNASASDSDNDNFLIVDWELNDQANNGDTESYYLLVPNNHAFAGNLLLGVARD